MNISEYISSGILEAYVLGDLTAGERKDVEDMIDKHPEIRNELAEIESTIEELALKTAISPDDALKKKIKDQINFKEEAKEIVLVNKPVVTNTIKYAVAASLTIALVTSYLAFDFWSKWQSTKSRLDNLIAQNQRIADDYNFVNQELQDIEADLEILANPDFNRILMRGTENSPNALASIYWNKRSEEVYLKIQNLQQLSDENQYQLWAIVDGVPVDLGVFDLSNDVMPMTQIADAAAFAVTIEPRGGSVNPSLETMQVVGNSGD
ncbi:MAG: anti-sigma factor [Cyclobacteriaceae bacterium]